MHPRGYLKILTASGDLPCILEAKVTKTTCGSVLPLGEVEEWLVSAGCLWKNCRNHHVFLGDLGFFPYSFQHIL